MAQHDYVIENQSAPAFRADLNSALAAAVSQNSGPTAPVVMFADMIWYDTANNQIKKRNEANSAWITLGTIDETLGTFTPNAQITTSQINPTTLVTAAETIAANNNDTTIPTSAAVKSYTDTAVAGVVTNAVTFLGTATVSGFPTSFTLSGINLTAQRLLLIQVNGVSTTGSSNIFITSSLSDRVVLGTTSQNINYFSEIWVDLATGVFTSTIGPPSGGTATSNSGGNCGITTASTAVTIGTNGSFDAGSFRVYGVK